MGGMKVKILITSILAAYVALAAAQDGPVQVWLFTLTPLAIISVAFVLMIADKPPLRSKPRASADRSQSELRLPRYGVKEPA